MAKARLQKTLADYLAIAATPILIILLVGSLVFFLQEMFFNGRVDRFHSRIHWVMFWYVIGMVLIARIAIESGRAHAGMFTLALGGAVSLFIFRFEKDHPLIAIGCLALIWWCADKLTWDCSLIDDSEDASGEGLLQVAGVADEAELPAEGSVPGNSRLDTNDDGNVPATERKTEAVPLWKRLFVNEPERAGKPHAPGLWVVYFSLAALPLFGVGQTMLARESSRDFAFQLLVTYVSAALGLLLLTSFLGLRRYLRQRNLAMPATMAASWVAMGAAIAIGILVVCLLLPRPDANYSVTAMIDDLGDTLQEAADHAFLDDDGGESDGLQSGPADKDAEQGEASDPNQQGNPGGEQPGQQTTQSDPKDGENGQQAGGEQSGGEQNGDSQQIAQNGEQPGGEQGNNDQPQKTDDQEVAQNDQQRGSDDKQSDAPSNRGDQQADENADNDKDAEQRQAEESSDDGDSSSENPESSPQLSSAVSMIGTFFKWIVYAVLAGVGLYFLWKHWAAIGSWFVQLWHEFLSLFGRRPATATAASDAEDETLSAPQRPFSAFRNPFGSRAAPQAQPAELVRYTFEALQAWACENGCPRSPDQTPIEFGNRLRSSQNPVGTEASELGELYARVAYAGYLPTAECLPILEKLWRKLT